MAAQEANALNEQGRTALNAGDFTRAETLFRQALEKTPNNVVIANNLGLALEQDGTAAFNVGNLARAEALYQQASQEYPGDTTIAQNLAMVRDRLASQQGGETRSESLDQTYNSLTGALIQEATLRPCGNLKMRRQTHKSPRAHR